MPCRLNKYTVCPPGSFLYTQTQGIQKKFASNPDIYDLARELAIFRKANGLNRAEYEQCFEDIDLFNCQRLGCHKQWCTDTDASKSYPVPRRKAGCSSCGAKLK